MSSSKPSPLAPKELCCPAQRDNHVSLPRKRAKAHVGESCLDFPGVVTAGTTLDDTRAIAEVVLAFHVEDLIAERGTIPNPSNLEEIMGNHGNQKAVAIFVPIKNRRL